MTINNTYTPPGVVRSGIQCDVFFFTKILIKNHCGYSIVSFGFWLHAEQYRSCYTVASIRARLHHENTRHLTKFVNVIH